MKLALASLLAAFAASSAFAVSDTILVQDDFSGSSLDTAVWQTLAPFSGSTVTVGNDVATSTSRGILATRASIPTPYTLGGSFRINSFDGMFSISLRSDLSTEPNFGAPSGVLITFINEYNQIQLTTLTAGGVSTQLVPSIGFTLNSATDYSFEITDDGANISLAVAGSSLANFSTAFATGGQIAFYGREYSGSSSSLDSVTISTTASAIPEPSSFAALAGLAGLGLAATRRRRAA